MKALLGDDVDRTAIGPRTRLLAAVRASNGASRRIPVLLQASPVVESVTSGSMAGTESVRRSVTKFSESVL